MEIKNYKEINSGCLKATFDLIFPKMGMTIKGIAIMKKGDRQKWVNMRNRQYELNEEKKRISFVYFERDKKEILEKHCFEKIEKGEFSAFEPKKDFIDE